MVAMLFTMVLSPQGHGGRLWIMTGSEKEHISKYMGIRAYLQRYICVALYFIGIYLSSYLPSCLDSHPPCCHPAV